LLITFYQKSFFIPKKVLFLYHKIIKTKIMQKQNPTLDLIDMLVVKHKLNKEKVINYILKNGKRTSSFKIFLSGFIFELSVNYKNIKTKLT